MQRLRDFYQTIDRIEGDRLWFRTLPQLRQAIERIGEKLALDGDRAETAGAIARYLWQRLKKSPEHRQIVELWQVFLLNRAAKVVQKIYPPNAARFDGDLESAYNRLLTRKKLAHPREFFSRFSIDAMHPGFLPILINWTDRSLRFSLWDALETTCQAIGDSDLSLVLKSSESRIHNALNASSLDSDFFDLAIVFREVHSSLGIAVNQWTDAQFQIVADRYGVIPSLTSEKVEKNLTEIGQAIRQYISPSLYPIASLIDQEGQAIDLFSLVADPRSDFSHPLYKEQAMIIGFQSCIDRVINGLTEPSLTIFDRYFLREETQSLIASDMDLTPTDISRQIKRIYHNIFSSLREWISETYPYLEIGDQVTAKIRLEIKHYLREYYTNGETE
jgi:hypothetical protein